MPDASVPTPAGQRRPLNVLVEARDPSDVTGRQPGVFRTTILVCGKTTF